MKRLLFTFAAIVAFSLTTDAQLVRVNGYETILSPKKAEDIPVDLQGIQYKKYLSKDYKPAYVDDYKDKAFLRYNIHDDQMEFIKDNKIFYLKKDVGRVVRFTDKAKYQVYEIDGELQFFLVHTTEGKNMLLAKQIVKYVEAREPNSGYDRGKPADYNRRKDELYFAFGDQEIVKVPRKKKEFFKLFGDKSSEVKGYIKENKLSYKKVKDLKKIVEYLNTLSGKA